MTALSEALAMFAVLGALQISPVAQHCGFLINMLNLTNTERRARPPNSQHNASTHDASWEFTSGYHEQAVLTTHCAHPREPTAGQYEAKLKAHEARMAKSRGTVLI